MNDERQILSVSALAEVLQGLLIDALPSLWVQGEVSNFRNPSGHWYFTLKDAGAQIRCAMFKNRNFYVRPPPKDGDQVLLRGRVEFYTTRGEVQIVAEHLEPAGAGALLRAFEDLKKKLAAEGLFEAKLKRPLPPAPRAIGVITSPTGAAIQDVLTTLRRRFPLGSVFIYPVPVQGPTACPALVRALKDLPTLAPVDLVMLARGGGSIEDLWCFNEEKVARSIRACRVPVITGIGHEIDFTIADFAADLRAPTPTAAAELASPDQREWAARAAQLNARIARRTGVLMQEQAQRVSRLQSRLAALHPQRRLQQHQQRLDEIGERLQRVWATSMGQRARRLSHLADLLASFSPRAVLERGYAIVRGPGGAIVRRADTLRGGDRLHILVAQGDVHADVAIPEK